MSERHATDRLAEEVDLVLRLLDRQIIDSEGALVAKVDDVELREGLDGLEVTGLLTGPAALLPRISTRVARTWAAMTPHRADRWVPHRMDLDLVERVESDVQLRRTRQDVATPQERDPRLHRLGDLMRASVVHDGVEVGHVLDVRAEPRAGAGRRLVVTRLLVGPARPGSLLGYDRDHEQGPWLVAVVIRWLHRNSRSVPIAEAEIDWDGGVVRIRGAADGGG